MVTAGSEMQLVANDDHKHCENDYNDHDYHDVTRMIMIRISLSQLALRCMIRYHNGGNFDNDDDNDDDDPYSENKKVCLVRDITKAPAYVFW